MPAPIVGFVIAFLTGAALPAATAEATLGAAAQAIIVVDRALADIARADNLIPPSKAAGR